MHLFAHPDRLWLLLALPPLAGWVAWGARRRSREWSELGQGGRPLGIGAWGWLGAIVLVALAVGQPRWGRTPGPEMPAGHDVVLVVDVSRSMGAEDAVPDRLGLAIESAASLLRVLAGGSGDRAAVVAFAGRGVVRCPLTAHLDSAVDTLRSLRPGNVEPGGTNLGAALEQAAGAFDDEDHADGRTIVVFSDGEDHVGSWPSIVDQLKNAGVVVHAVAIGDPDRAHPVPLARSKDFRKGAESGPETRRSDAALQAIARATGGVLVPVGLAPVDLGALFRDRIEPTARRTRDEARIATRAERFPVFVLPAIGLGVAASWPGLARRRWRRIASSALGFALLTAAGAGPAGQTTAGLIRLGNEAYAKGRFAEALGAYDRAVSLNPAAAVPRFDAASALFQLRRFSEAITRYEEARERGDDRLSVKIDYGLGNACLALGEVAEAVARYDACLVSTIEGDGLDQVRADAAANRAFAAERITPPTEPADHQGQEPPGSRKGRTSPRPSKDSRGVGDPSGAPDQSAPSGGPGSHGGSAPPSGVRGGGGGQAPPQAGSPVARLNAALDEIREARRRRLPEPPRSGSNGGGKDW